MHEVLVSADEMDRTRDLGDYFVIGKDQTDRVGEYTSTSTTMLEIDQVVELLRVAGL
jgi:hypothetical protein